MASFTAVELAADTCVLARTTVRKGLVAVSRVETIDPRAFAGGGSFAAALNQARRRAQLPRRAHVIVWGLPEGTARRDPLVEARIQPFVEAGFRIHRVVSPCDALAALARVRVPRGEGATCWLAINTGAVAIVVVRPGAQLYARSVAWDSTIGASGSQARLLQRYSLVSFLSPEVRRAMAAARQKGTPVDGVITCGNLPDLRSLTMPLIEELDVEVETLDSLEGLIVEPSIADRVADLASAIRLACAATVARPTRQVDEGQRRAARRAAMVLPAAAAVAVLAVIGFGVREWRQPVDIAAPPADKPAATSAAAVERLPRVTAIVLAGDRRTATIDGRVVGIGDTVGSRTVVEIDATRVVLREPSGTEFRLLLDAAAPAGPRK